MQALVVAATWRLTESLAASCRINPRFCDAPQKLQYCMHTVNEELTDLACEEQNCGGTVEGMRGC